MSKITERLDSLKPHIIGIRYVEGFGVVDAVFKKGWHVLKSDTISFTQGKEKAGYYMFYTENEDVGFDEILDHVEKIIKYNIDREVKHQLLKDKVEDLKVLFKNHTLEELLNLKFVLGEQPLVSDELEDDLMIDDIPPLTNDEIEQRQVQNQTVAGVELPPKPAHKDGQCLHGPDEFCDNCMDRIMGEEETVEQQNA